MASSSSVEMLLKLSAIVQGMAGVKQLGEAFKQGAKQAGLANMSFMKMAKSAAVVALGFKGIQGTMDFFKGAIEEANAAVKAEEKLGVALSRRKDLAAEAAKKGTTIEKQTQALIELADQMELTGVVSATSLKTGFAGLTAAGFSPATIQKSAKGFEGLVIGLKGVGASASDVGEVSNQIKSIIKLGTKARLPMEWKKLMTEKDLATFKTLNTERKRAAWIQDLMAKNEWRIAAAMGTTEGQLWRAGQAWRRIQETIGKPFAKTRLAFAQASERLANALEPTIKKIADRLTPAFQDLAAAIGNQGPAIEKFGGMVADAFTWVVDHWDVVSKGLTAIGVALGTWGVIALITNPLTLFIAGLTALSGAVVALVENWDKIKPAVDRALGAIQAFAQPAIDATKPIWEPIVKGAEELSGKIRGPLGTVADEIGKVFSSKKFLNPATGSMEKLQEKPDISRITDSFSEIGTAITSYDWGALGGQILSGITTVVQNINWGDVANALKNGLQTAISNALTLGGQAAGMVGGVAMDFGTMIAAKAQATDWSVVAQAIGAGLGKAIVGLTGMAWDFSNLTLQMGTNMVNAIGGMDWNGIIIAISNGIDSALTGIVDFGLNVAIGLVDGIIQGITGQDLGQITTTLVSGLQKTLTAIIAEVSTWGPKIMAAIQSGLGQITASIGYNLNPFNWGKQQPQAAPAPEAGKQLGGLVSHPGIWKLAEKGAEMVIPMQSSARSRGLLSQAAEGLGMGFRGTSVGGPISASVSPTINIGSELAGQAGAIQREVERAMENPVKTLLEQLKLARDEEHRLAYV